MMKVVCSNCDCFVKTPYVEWIFLELAKSLNYMHSSKYQFVAFVLSQSSWVWVLLVLVLINQTEMYMLECNIVQEKATHFYLISYIVLFSLTVQIKLVKKGLKKFKMGIPLKRINK